MPFFCALSITERLNTRAVNHTEARFSVYMRSLRLALNYLKSAILRRWGKREIVVLKHELTCSVLLSFSV